MKELVKKLEKVVKNNKSKCAYIVNSKSITYGDLWKKACLCADLLKREGSSPVIIYSNKCIKSFVMMISCIIANRPYVYVDKAMPISRLNEIINLTKSSIVISDERLDFCPISISFDELNKFKNLEKKNIDNNTAYIIFTSGSTGKPKGVPISYDNLNNFINWISNFKPLKDYKNINVLNQASFSFDLSVADMFYSLCNGHTLVSANDNFDVINTIETYNINTMFVTNTFIKYCLLNKTFNSDQCTSLKCIYLCGEQLEKEVVKKLFSRFPDLVVINAYGPTEATSAVSGIIITNDILNNDMEILPVGSCDNFATDIEINNNEIILGGKSVFSGYLNYNNDSFIRKNNKTYFRTGDIGFIDNNMLYCKGRLDSLIKYKGYRIELEDIENSIKSIDFVDSCVVIPVYNDNNVVKSIKAFVKADKNIDSKYIKDKLKDMVPEYMIPRTIVFVEKFPINKNFKIDRKALIEYDKCC